MSEVIAQLRRELADAKEGVATLSSTSSSSAFSSSSSATSTRNTISGVSASDLVRPPAKAAAADAAGASAAATAASRQIEALREQLEEERGEWAVAKAQQDEIIAGKFCAGYSRSFLAHMVLDLLCLPFGGPVLFSSSVTLLSIHVSIQA